MFTNLKIMNKYKVAQWILRIISSCKTHEQTKICMNLIVNHIKIFDDSSLATLMVAHKSDKHRELELKES